MNFDNLRDLLVGVSTTPVATSDQPSNKTITTTNYDKTANFPSAMAFDLSTNSTSQTLPPELISSFSLLTTTCNDSDIVPFKFDTPSPDDIVLDRRKQAFKQKKSIFKQQQQRYITESKREGRLLRKRNHFPCIHTTHCTNSFYVFII